MLFAISIIDASVFDLLPLFVKINSPDFTYFSCFCFVFFSLKSSIRSRWLNLIFYWLSYFYFESL